MGSDFARRLREEVPEWVAEGIIEETQAQRILDRYQHAPAGADEAETNAAFRVFLYATAAILIGAAALAFVFVGLDPAQPGNGLLALGLLSASLGVGLHVFHGERDLLVDALLGASMVPLAAAAVEAELTLAPVFALGLPVAYLAWRWEKPFLPTLSVIGFSVAAAATVFAHETWAPASEEASAQAWLIVQGVFLAALVGYDRLRGADWTAPAALGVLAIALAFLVYLMEITSLASTGIELALGGMLAGLLLVSLALRHQGMAVGASVGLGVDAIVFAFDVDELFGTVVLLALGGLAIWQAEALRDLLEPASD